MNRNRWALLGCLALAAAAGRLAAQPRAVVATLTNPHPEVKVRASGSVAWVSVTASRNLYEGDAVRIGATGSAVLVQADCPIRKLQANEELIVSAGKKWLLPGRKPVSREYHRSLADMLDRLARSTPSRSTGMRDPGDNRPPPELILTPREENLLDGRPTFTWRPGPKGTRFEATLYQGDRAVWEPPNTDQTSLTYPAKEPPLAPGEYRFQLLVHQPGTETPMVDEVGFQVLDAASAARIRAEVEAAKARLAPGDPPGRELIDLYLAHRLFTPAAQALRRALAASPGDPGIGMLLAEVYALTGRRSDQWDLMQELQAGGGAGKTHSPTTTAPAPCTPSAPRPSNRPAG